MTRPAELKTTRPRPRHQHDDDLDIWAEINADPQVREFSGSLLTRVEAAAPVLHQFKNPARVRRQLGPGAGSAGGIGFGGVAEPSSTVARPSGFPSLTVTVRRVA